METSPVTPAEAGVQKMTARDDFWIPASAGMTDASNGIGVLRPRKVAKDGPHPRPSSHWEMGGRRPG